MKILAVGHSFSTGGAARAAARINSSLRQMGLMVQEWTLDACIDGGNRIKRVRQMSLWEHRAWKLAGSSQFRSIGMYGSLSAGEVDAGGYDVVLLHWLGRGVMSTQELSRVRTPKVWVLHDLWPVLALNHYLGIRDQSSLREVWEQKTPPRRKLRALANSHLVAPSTWVLDVVDRRVGGQVPHLHIPYPLSSHDFVPVPQSAARAQLGLPATDCLIGFADLSGVNDDRKGWQFLAKCLRSRKIFGDNVKIVVAGMKTRGLVEIPGIGQVISVGFLSTNAQMSNFYSAVDVMAIPSTEDAVNQVATEAQMCGRIVVAFECTGIGANLRESPSVVLVKDLTEESFSDGLSRALQQQVRGRQSMVDVTRKWAMAQWDPSVVGSKYVRLFDGLAH